MKKYIFSLILASALTGAILYSLCNIDNAKQSIIAGNKFYEILFSKKDSNLLEEIDSNWKYLANFESASNHTSTLTEATSIYSDMINDQDAPSIFRELAQYLEVMNLLRRGEKIDENNLVSSSVYPYSSQEATAIIKIHNDDIKGAVEILHSLLNDRKCPTLIKANAQELLRIYEN